MLKELRECASYWSEYDVPLGIHERINEAVAECESVDGLHKMIKEIEMSDIFTNPIIGQRITLEVVKAEKSCECTGCAFLIKEAGGCHFENPACQENDDIIFKAVSVDGNVDDLDLDSHPALKDGEFITKLKIT